MSRRLLRVAGVDVEADERLALAIDLSDRYPLLGDAVIETGEYWLDAATVWQLDDVAAMLSTAPDDPRYLVCTRPRGGSKTSDAGLAALVVMLSQVEPLAECYTVAADSDQAAKVLRKMRGWIVRAPASSELVDVTAYLSKIVSPAGVTMEIIAADGSSAYGGTPALTIVDELGQWGRGPAAREVWTAIFTALVKRADARLWALTTKPRANHWSNRIISHARKSERWRYAAVTEAVPWQLDEARDEQAALLDPGDFARLHLNESPAASSPPPAPDEMADRFTGLGLLPAKPSESVERMKW